MGMVNQPVHQRRRQSVIAKDGVPLAEFEVGGDDEAFLLVAVGDDLKQQLGGILVQRNEPNLVDHNQFRALQGVQKAMQGALLVLLQQQVGKLRGGKEAGAFARLTGAESNHRREMGLSRADCPQVGSGSPFVRGT